MISKKVTQVSTSALLALVFTSGTLGTIAQAQDYNNTYPREPYPTRNDNYRRIIEAGTEIPLGSSETDKILLTKEELLSITLEVLRDIRDNQGVVIIPAGTEISGQIQPVADGSQFIAETIIFRDGRRQNIDGYSRVITRTETIDRRTNPRTILQGAVVGAAAATVLAAVTGDKAIATEEVLGGVGLGALGGWLFGNGRSQELISIDPNRDLDIILASDFFTYN